MIRAGFVIGIGMMGFFDGILFHQILQIHRLITDIQYQTFAEGIFNAGIWVITLIGIFMLFKSETGFNIQTIKTKAFTGTLLMGGGFFLLAEGLINHQLLGIHHILPGTHQLIADMVYLGIGIALIILGYFLIRKKEEF